MVAPALAAAATRGGSMAFGIRSSAVSFGGKEAGAAAVTGKKTKDGIEITKILKKNEDSLKSIKKSSIKAVATLERVSPAFKQQIVIMRKSLEVILRPIGDIMAKFLRPMSVWMIKFAMKWYDLFGTGGGAKDSPQVIEDEIKQLEKEQEQAIKRGDISTANIAGEKILEKKRKLGKEDSPEKETKSFFDSLREKFSGIKNFANTVWEDFVPESFQIMIQQASDALKELGEFAQNLWEILKPVLEPIYNTLKSIAGLAISALFIGIAAAIKSVIIPIKNYNTVWKKTKELTKKFLGVIKDMPTAIDDFKKKVSEIFTNLGSEIVTIFEDIKSKVKGFFSFDFLNKDKDKAGNASGLDVRETGFYKLHAGEKVLNSGETQRLQTTQSTINNYYNISAKIANDVDIKNLAKKLSRYQETEQRRRSSYI